MRAILTLLFGLTGVLIGCVLGVLSAHHFPVIGGFVASIAKPYSEAKWELVPGHVLIWGSALGVMFALVGLGISFMFRKPSSTK